MGWVVIKQSRTKEMRLCGDGVHGMKEKNLAGNFLWKKLVANFVY